MMELAVTQRKFMTNNVQHRWVLAGDERLRLRLRRLTATTDMYITFILNAYDLFEIK